MKNKYPPLKLWILVSSIFLFIQVLIGMFQADIMEINYQNIKSIINQEHLDVLSDFKHSFNENNFNAIIVGTSLVNDGVQCHYESTSSEQKEINIRKLWRSENFDSFFLNNSLINEIIKIKPDLLLIQAELFGIEFNNKRGFMTKQSISNKILLKKIFRINTIKTTLFEECYYNKQAKPIFQYDSLSFKPNKRFINLNHNINNITKALKKFREAKIKIIAVDIPRPIKTEKIVYTKKFRHDLKALFKKYKKLNDIDYWVYNGQVLYFKHFRDGAHMNKSGRSVYTDWLRNKIKKEF
ncbi:hypothetical protein [Tenacibaculum xiamenense]|uniref:hypothetical protein n=1 Tax=Tenacibaculum xiamenense TaxID=1261553 RepID=UPI003894B986